MTLKVPKLDAEQMSMVGLNLFMQLMNLAKQNSDQLDSHDDQVRCATQSSCACRVASVFNSQLHLTLI